MAEHATHDSLEEEAEVDQNVFLIGLAYALIGVASFALWALLGDGDAARNRAPVDLPPFLGILILAVALAMGMRSGSIRFRLSLPEKTAAAVFVVALGWGLTLNAVDPAYGIDGLTIRLPHLMAAIGLTFVLTRSTRASCEFMAGAIPAQTLLHMPIVIYLYLFHVADPDINWAGGPIGYWHVRIWGMILAAGIAATLGIYAAHVRAPLAGQIIAFLTFTVLFTALFWSGSRAGVLGVGVAALACSALIPGAFLRALPLFLAAAVLGAGVSAMLEVPYYSYGVFNRVGGNSETATATAGALGGGRLEMWRGALAEIMQHPVFGNGFNQYYPNGAEQTDGIRHVQPHNAIVQLFYDFGLVGGAAALFLLCAFWWRGVSATLRHRQTWKYGAFCALFCLVTISMFDGALFHHDPLLAIVICLAILNADPRAPGREPADPV